ncbi:hypothetical protein AB0442_39490 [Kitasatospora sp. NPDC085895]|uniref:hypothetical protein n=1 Tax=Kitasatospora sp. NPDC085895 TaxID=3155057 RepID=UPI003450BD44
MTDTADPAPSWLPGYEGGPFTTAELLAQDDGHFTGPAPSWPELAVAADLPPGAGTLDADILDAHAGLLLLLPAMGDNSPPAAAPRPAASLRARTAVEDPDHLALLLLEQQGQPGPAHRRTTQDGVRVNGGRYSHRDLANPFVLRRNRLAGISAALTP